MDGKYYGFTFFSAAALDKMDWVDPIEIDSTAVDTTLVLPAVPNPRAYVKVRTQEPGQYYYLEYRNADSPYVQSPQGKVGCASVVVNHTGLLVTRVAHFGFANWNEYHAAEISPESATGRFASDGSPDPNDGENLLHAESDLIVYGNGFTNHPTDLFYPGNVNVFGPYTNPRTDICSYYPWSSVPRDNFEVYTGITIETVEFRAGDDSLVVRIRYGGSAAPADADTLIGNTTWDGRVQLTADLVVAEGDTLTVAEGSEVIASARTDRLGADERPQIDVRGVLIVEGTSQDPVLFTSSRDEDFDHFRGPGEPGEDPAPDDWFGMLLSPSIDHLLEYPEIRYPRFGVVLDSLAGDITLPRFVETDSADIFLDRDLHIKAGISWKLAGPTRVVADTLDRGRGGLGDGEDTTRVEVLVRGRLGTTGSTADSVTFTSTIEDGVNGDDWVGMTFSGPGVSDLSFLEIGYAEYPLAFFDTDTARVRRSKVHHFSADGILDWGSDAWIDTCEVIRGSALLPSVSTTGIHLASSASQLRGTTVGEQSDYGIWVDRSKSYCEIDSVYPAPDPDTLRISGCVVDGALETATGVLGGVGVYLSWLCHEVRTEIDGNEIRDWGGGISELAGSGLALDRCADVQVSCNEIRDNKTGLFYRRDGTKLPAGEEAVWLGQNYFGSNALVNLCGKIGIFGLDLTTGAAAGDNSFRAYPATGGQKKNIVLSSVSSSDTLDVTAQHWIRSSGETYTSIAAVDSTFDPGSGTILISSLLEEANLCGSSAAPPGPVAGRLDGDRSRPAADRDGVAVLSLGSPRPNPAPDVVRLQLEVPAGGERVDLTVYDVGGRLVRRLVDGILEGGRYDIVWDGRSDQRTAAAPGIYFVRLSTPERQWVRKVVIAR